MLYLSWLKVRLVEPNMAVLEENLLQFTQVINYTSFKRAICCQSYIRVLQNQEPECVRRAPSKPALIRVENLWKDRFCKKIPVHQQSSSSLTGLKQFSQEEWAKNKQ